MEENMQTASQERVEQAGPPVEEASFIKGAAEEHGAIADGEQGPERPPLPQARQGGVEQGDLTRFLQAFPGVRGDDVPTEVWRQVAAGESLTTAYVMYENQRLRALVAAQRQNGENVKRSLGSLANPRGEKARKTLEDYWDEAAL